MEKLLNKISLSLRELSKMCDSGMGREPNMLFFTDSGTRFSVVLFCIHQHMDDFFLLDSKNSGKN